MVCCVTWCRSFAPAEERAWSDPRRAAPRLGGEGDGFKFAQNWISAGRIRHGARGIGVIVDYVVNHSAAQHPLFVEALKGPDNPYRALFVWREVAPQQCTAGVCDPSP